MQVGLKEIYGVGIEKDANDSLSILLVNFCNLGDNVEAKAILDGRSISITLPQVLPGGYTIKSGTGSISSSYNQIDWTYIIDDGSGIVDNVTATYTKY